MLLAQLVRVRTAVTLSLNILPTSVLPAQCACPASSPQRVCQHKSPYVLRPIRYRFRGHSEPVAARSRRRPFRSLTRRSLTIDASFAASFISGFMRSTRFVFTLKIGGLADDEFYPLGADSINSEAARLPDGAGWDRRIQAAFHAHPAVRKGVPPQRRQRPGLRDDLHLYPGTIARDIEAALWAAIQFPFGSAVEDARPSARPKSREIPFPRLPPPALGAYRRRQMPTSSRANSFPLSFSSIASLSRRSSRAICPALQQVISTGAKAPRSQCAV